MEEKYFLERLSTILTNWREGDDEKIRKLSEGGKRGERKGQRRSGGEMRSGDGVVEEGGEREKRYILDRVIRETSVPDLKIFSSPKLKIKFEFEKFSTSVYVSPEMKVSCCHL